MVPHTAQDDAQGAQFAAFAAILTNNEQAINSDNASILLIEVPTDNDRLKQGTFCFI